MQNLTNIIRSSYSTSGFMLFASPVAALPEPIEALPRCPSGRWCTRWCHGGTMLWHFAVYYSSLRVGVSVGAGPRSVPGRGLPPPGRSDHPLRAETDRPGPKWLVSVPQRRGAGPYCQPRSRRSAGSLVCGLDGMSWPPRSCDTSWLYSYAYTVHGSSGVGIGHAVYMRYTLCLDSCVVG